MGLKNKVEIVGKVLKTHREMFSIIIC